MKTAYIAGTNIVSSLGFSTADNFDQISKVKTGIKLVHNPVFSPFPFFASLIDNYKLKEEFIQIDPALAYTRLEKMCIVSIKKSLQNLPVNLKNSDTLLILVTTKGNIDVLEKNSGFNSKRAYLSEFANVVGDYFSAVNKPLVICNACISGVMGLIAASRLIASASYKHIVVCGGDLVSAFTVAGFQTFKAFGSSPCKPYDTNRDGLSLGEGAATVVLTADENIAQSGKTIAVKGGSVSNDANHISGPSRSGDGLYFSIKNALSESHLNAGDISYISAHGTATPFNDEMECKAFYTAGLDQTPVNSFKGALGHTLGAAGVIESALSFESINRQSLLPSVGYAINGLSLPLNIITEEKPGSINYVLKTASGFGGCNASVIFENCHGQ